ncbi:copper resistance CopC family protein [Amycolatopsis acidicola]|uniref:copper resistance CopC family protein n=1 Tax=Amycolatopsis acidicola TaxID=2596893 RepID=UPI001FB605DC|nr:copper resistance CopC family protein [Amycolatopsis acidicola]
MPRKKNLLIRGVSLVFVLGALLLAGTRAADAHNVLESSSPAAGASLTASPSTVELTFNEPIESGFNELVVTGPDKTSQWQNGAATVSAEKISVPLRPLGPAGEYTVAYHIVSEDGHPVSGSYTFTLTVAGTGTPAQGQSAVAGAPAGDESTVPVWVWVAGGVVLLGAGVVIARRIAR